MVKTPGEEHANFVWGLANAYFRINARVDAYRLLENLAQKQPTSLLVRLALFDLALEDKKEDEQGRLFAAIKRLEGDGPFWRQAQAILLVQEAHAKKPGEVQPLLIQARKHLDEVGKLAPRWYRVPALEAEIDVLEGRPAQAIEHYQRAMSLGDRRPAIVRGLIQLLFERRRFAEAERAVSQLIDQEQTLLIAAGLGKMATDGLLRTDRERALQFALESVPTHSKSYKDHLWLGGVLSKLEQLPELRKKMLGRARTAEQAFERARELAPDAPETWIAHIDFLARAGRRDQAKETLAEAKKHLRSQDAALFLAAGHEAVGEMKQAEEYFSAALKTKPEPEVQREVASFFLRTSQPEKAVPLLRTIIADSEASAAFRVLWARRNLAVALAAQKDYQKLQEALKLVDTNIRTGEAAREDQRVKGILLATQPGRRKEALQTFEEAHRQELLAGPDLFVLAQLYDRENNWAKAELSLLTLLGSPQGDSPGYLAYYVRRLIDRKDLAKAEAWSKKLERGAPQALVTVDVKARLLRAKKEDREAVALVRRRLQENSDFEFAIALLGDLAEDADSKRLYLQCGEELYGSRSKTPAQSLAYAQFLIRHDGLSDAMSILEKTVEQSSTDVKLKAALMVAAANSAKQSDYERVEAWLRQAGTPPSRGVLLCLGHLRVRQGAYREAASLYEKVVEQEPRNPHELDQYSLALNNLAWLAALAEKDYPKARQLIDRALAVTGPVAHVLDTRGLVDLLQDDSKAAISAFTQALSIKESAAYRFHLARAYFLARNRAEAINAFRKAKARLTADTVGPLERAAFQQLQAALESPQSSRSEQVTPAKFADVQDR
jgi:tetratricopeptide (TPR) repeat protein